MPPTLAPASQGAFTRIALVGGEPPYTFTGATQVCYNHEDVAKRGRIVFGNSICGTRTRFSARSRPGAAYHYGRIHYDLTPANLDLWAPWFFGSPKDGSDQFPFMEMLPTFGLMMDKENDVFVYEECMASRMYIRGRQPDPQASRDPDATEELIELVVEIIATRELKNQTWPAGITMADNDIPYVFTDGAFVLGPAQTEQKVLDCAIGFDNHVRARYANSLEPTSIVPRDRSVKVTTSNPWTSDEAALYDWLFPGFPGSFTFTNGNASARFDFPMLQCPPLTPTVRGKVEIPIHLRMDARSTAAGEQEITLTNDSNFTA